MAAIHLTSINPTTSPSSSSFPTHLRAGFLPSVSPNPIAASPPKLRSVVVRWGIRRKEVGTGFRWSRMVVSSLGKLSETELVSVPEDPKELVGKFPTGAGVYGVYDGSGALQFIGITMNIAGSVVSHRKSLPDLCCSVKVGVIDEPAPDRAVLTDAWKAWMQEHIEATGFVPPGNESGNNTWLRRPQKKPDLRLTPGRHVKLAVPLEDLIDRLVKENRVVAFIKGSRSSPQCGFSQRVVGILESEGMDFECVNVLDEEYNCGLRETLKAYSNWPTFPQIFVNGELLGGCDILAAMAEQGELGSLLEK